MQQPQICSTCPLVAEPGRITEIIERLATVTQELKNVAERLDRGAADMERIHTSVHSIEVDNSAIKTRLDSHHRRLDALERKADANEHANVFMRGTWKTLGIIGTVIVAIGGAIAWIYEHVIAKALAK